MSVRTVNRKSDTKAAKTAFRAGTASINITPPIGVELCGWPFGPSQGVLDELYAKALVLDDGNKTVAIVTTDLIGIDAKYVQNIRLGIQKECGIEPGHVLISASHTHSGPAAYYLREWGKIDEDWVADLQKKLMEVVGAAGNNLREARIGAGRGNAAGISHNRKTEDGVIDTEVGVVRVDDADGEMTALLVNFSCHPVSLHNYENLISPDYPGYVAGLIRKAKGDKVTTLFTTGAAGNINPYPDGFEHRNPKVSERMGTILGCEALKIAEQIETTAEIDLKVDSRKVDVPLQKLPTAENLEKIISEEKQNLEKLRKEKASRVAVVGAGNSVAWALEALEAVRKGQLRENTTFDIQVIFINDLAMVAISGEVFVEIGLAIKAESSHLYTFVIEQANGAAGYIPTREAFERGYYEADYAAKVHGLYSYTPDVGKIVKSAVTKLLT